MIVKGLDCGDYTLSDSQGRDTLQKFALRILVIQHSIAQRAVTRRKVADGIRQIGAGRRNTRGVIPRAFMRRFGLCREQHLLGLRR